MDSKSFCFSLHFFMFQDTETLSLVTSSLASSLNSTDRMPSAYLGYTGTDGCFSSISLHS